MRFLSFFIGVSTLCASLYGVQAHSVSGKKGDEFPKSLKQESADNTVLVERYWARPGKKGQNTAVYMTLKSYVEANALVKASSPLCREVQVHSTFEEVIEGTPVQKMREVEAIDLPKGHDVLLMPGGFHIMLIGLHKDLSSEGSETVPVTLTFKMGQTLDLAVPVRKDKKPCSCCEEAAKKKA